MIELNNNIKNALIKIDFIKRYEDLSNLYNADRTPSDERLIYIDGEEVMEMIQDRGYKPIFDSEEKFYKIHEEKIGPYTFGFHIILNDGLVDLVWIVKQGEDLLLGAPWSAYSRRMIDVNYRIKKPVFGTYEDLEEILKTSFDMYEDFKKAICSRASGQY